MIIGGMFGLEDPLAEGTPPPWRGRESHTLLTANARGAIRWLAEHVRAKQVWMPSYLCHTMVDWIDQRRYPVAFYPVDLDLRATDHAWLSEVGSGDLVVNVAWFGRRADPVVGALSRAAGAVVLEDASQAWFTAGLGATADWLVFSPRKVMGVPDGGAIVSLRGERLDGIELPLAPWAWWKKLLAATISRRTFDLIGDPDGPRDWFESWREADREAPLGVYAMSELSRRRLEAGSDAEAPERRRRNHEVLQEALEDVALLPRLEPGEVPLGFVARFATPALRDRVRETLMAARVYPMIHWPIHGVVPQRFSESHELGGRILTLVCDQRCTPDQMAGVAKLVRGVLGAA